MKSEEVMELAILTVLQGGPGHGYQLYLRLRAQDATLKVTASALYPRLHAFENDGLLALTAEPSSSGPPKRVYALSVKGEARRSELQERLEQQVRGWSWLRPTLGGS